MLQARFLLLLRVLDTLYLLLMIVRTALLFIFSSLTQKSFSAFLSFQALVEKACETKMNILHSNRGGEYNSGELFKYFKETALPLNKALQRLHSTIV